MPDDSSSVPNPVNVPTPTLPMVADSSASVAGADAPVPSVPVPDAPVPSMPAPSTSVSDTVVKPVNPTTATTSTGDEADVNDTDVPAEVARKIGDSHNVLVALSSDPSVDEMAAAIGLSLYLDRLGKRATAIYSGQTPNALEFLKPEETFEPSADTLQDFVIALNKDKADHLRYKLDGDYVKVYITPYKSRISEEDLDFSYGDYNVDLVLALDVANGVDLDAALREHGRIMHDAVIINITTGNPGKLGEIEWSDKAASSVSEMIARLLYSVNSKIKIEKEEATAFLTGIVAATNRFSNAGTTPETMQIASKLMESGANQQLVSKNITPEVENEMLSMGSFETTDSTREAKSDPTKLDIQHNDKKEVNESKEKDDETADDGMTGDTKEGDVATEKEPSLLDDLKAAEASLATAGTETAPEAENKPLEIESVKGEGLPEVENEVKEEVGRDENMMNAGIVGDNKPVVEADEPIQTTEQTQPTESAQTTEPVKTAESIATDTTQNSEPTGTLESSMNAENVNAENPSGDFVSDKPEKVIQPSAEILNNIASGDESDKYGQMLEDALANSSDTVTKPEIAGEPTTSMPNENPAVASAPTVASNPEINGVPEINYMPMPGEEVLPPPPAPPIDMSAPVPEATIAPMSVPEAASSVGTAPIEPAVPAPVAGGTNESLGAQPAMQDQVYAPQAADPGAFKIPGM